MSSVKNPTASFDVPSLRAAKAHWDKMSLDPADVTFAPESLLRGAPESAEVGRLAAALGLSSGRSDGIHARAMLIAAVGPTLASRLLERTHTRERWVALVDTVNSGSTSQTVPVQVATRLRRELRGPAAAALRAELGKSGLSRAKIEVALEGARAAGISGITLSTLLREATPKFGIFLRHDAEALLTGLAVEVEVQSLFACAGDATHLRDIPPENLVKDEALFLDAFELFVRTNDEALKLISDVSEHLGSALRHDGSFETHSDGTSLTTYVDELKHEVDMMLKWYHGLAKENANEFVKIKAKEVFSKLDEATDRLDRTLSLGYQRDGVAPGAHGDSNAIPWVLKKEHDNFLGVVSKSKPCVDFDTIETVEELIRILHREVAALYGEHVRTFAAQGLVMRKSHPIRANSPHNDRSLKLTYVGSHSPETFKTTPMGKIRDALRGYFLAGANSTRPIEGGIMTDKTMAFDLRLGCHTGRLNITYDGAHDLYFVEWGMQEPGSSERRINFAREYFQSLGYEHNYEGTKHWARRKVSPADIEKCVWLMMYSLDNMLDLDISTPRLSTKALLSVFNRWFAATYKPTEELENKSGDEKEVADGTPKTDAPKEATALPIPDRKTITELIKSDDFVFYAAESSGTDSRQTMANAIAMFALKHADALGIPSKYDRDVFQARCTSLLEAYLANIRPELLKELEKDGIAPATYDARTLPDKLKGYLDGLSYESKKSAMKELYSSAKQLVGPVFQGTV